MADISCKKKISKEQVRLFAGETLRFEWLIARIDQTLRKDAARHWGNSGTIYPRAL